MPSEFVPCGALASSLGLKSIVASMTVEADGWVLTFYNDCDTLDYCDSCYSPEGRAFIFDSLQSYSTDPVELLSTWEHAQLENLLGVA